MNRITKTSIDTSVSINNEIQILKQHPMVQKYLLLGFKQPKAIVRPSHDWNDNAQFVMTQNLATKNKFHLHGLLAKNVIGINIVATRPRDANFQVRMTYPRVQS